MERPASWHRTRSLRAEFDLYETEPGNPDEDEADDGGDFDPDDLDADELDGDDEDVRDLVGPQREPNED